MAILEELKRGASSKAFLSCCLVKVVVGQGYHSAASEPTGKYAAPEFDLKHHSLARFLSFSGAQL